MDAFFKQRTGHTERWVLNSPATRNALTDATVEAMLEACNAAFTDPELRFIVLTGSGGSFCAGGSLGSFSRLIGQPLAVGEVDPLIALNQRFGDLLNALSALPQILIAAVDGPAMGGGLGLLGVQLSALQHELSRRAVTQTPPHEGRNLRRHQTQRDFWRGKS